VDLKDISAYSVAGVLTHFFNESQEPIFPYEVYDLCIECMEIEPLSIRVECIRTMLNVLPPGNRMIIKRFLKVLYECSKYSEVNKMSTQNLAIAMSPTMLRPKEETIETLIAHGDTLTNLVQTLIANYTTFFENNSSVDNLPGSVPDSFIRVLDLAKKNILSRLPPGWLELHGPKASRGEIPEEEKPIAKFQALVKGYLLRKKLRGLNIPYQTAYNRAAWDYIKRESNFVHAMKRAIRDFETSLGDNKAGKRIKSLKALSSNASKNTQAKNAEAEVKNMINSFKEVIGVHEKLFEELMKIWDNSWPGVKKFGLALVTQLPLFETYNAYIDVYCRVDGLINAKDPNPELRKWLQKETGSAGYSRTLDDMLKLPFNHVLGCGAPIQQFLNAVLIYHIDPEDTNSIVKAFALLSRLQTVLRDLDKRLNYQRIAVIESSILGLDSNLELASLDRQLIRKGPISIDRQHYYMLLFDDVCIITTQTKDTYIYNYYFQMKNVKILDPDSTGFVLVVSQPEGTKELHVSAKKQEERMALYIAFKQVISRCNTDRFGVPLHVLEAREKTPEGIPAVVKFLCEYLVEAAAQEGQQIFCLGSDPYRVASLKIILNTTPNLSSVDLTKQEPSVVVDVLKMFLLELPTPLLVKADCQCVFIDDAGTDLDLNTFREVIQRLPEPSLKLLTCIAELLASTGLHPSILAQTWGHTIYRGVQENVTSALYLVDVTTIIRALLLHYRTLCGVATEQVIVPPFAVGVVDSQPSLSPIATTPGRGVNRTNSRGQLAQPSNIPAKKSSSSNLNSIVAAAAAAAAKKQEERDEW